MTVKEETKAKEEVKKTDTPIKNASPPSTSALRADKKTVATVKEETKAKEEIRDSGEIHSEQKKTQDTDDSKKKLPPNEPEDEWSLAFAPVVPVNKVRGLPPVKTSTQTVPNSPIAVKTDTVVEIFSNGTLENSFGIHNQMCETLSITETFFFNSTPFCFGLQRNVSE